MIAPRTPESLTRLERNWLKRRYCAWCEAPTHVNACYSMIERCSNKELNERRGKWLTESYRPRTPQGDRSPKGQDGEAGLVGDESAGPGRDAPNPTTEAI